MFCQRLIIKLTLTLLIGTTLIIGDKIEENLLFPFHRAFCDNFIHAIVALFSWTLIIVLSNASIINNINDIFLCTLLSSLIDLDHFIAAKSLTLNNAIRLDKRPFLHSTTIPILIWALLLFISHILKSTQINNYAWIILTSFLTHHIRDGARRGLWFAPIGSTKPIPYHVYILTSIFLPYIIYYLLSVSKNYITINQLRLPI